MSLSLWLRPHLGEGASESAVSTFHLLIMGHSSKSSLEVVKGLRKKSIELGGWIVTRILGLRDSVNSSSEVAKSLEARRTSILRWYM